MNHVAGAASTRRDRIVTTARRLIHVHCVVGFSTAEK